MLRNFLKKISWHDRLLNDIKSWKSTSKEQYYFLLNRVDLGELTELDRRIFRTIRLILPYSTLRLTNTSLNLRQFKVICYAINLAHTTYSPNENNTSQLLNYRIMAERLQIQPALRTISFNRFVFGSGYMECLLKVLKNKKNTIQVLELSKCDLKTEDLKGIGQMLVRNRSLRVLTLSENPLGNGMQHLADGLIGCNLQTLKLRGCGLGNLQAKLLVGALCQNSAAKLTCLDVGDNAIHQRAKSFWKLFKFHPSLKIIHLDNNDIEHEVAKKLFTKMQTLALVNLAKINLKNNPKIIFKNVPNCQVLTFSTGDALALENEKIKDSINHAIKTAASTAKKVGTVVLIAGGVILFIGVSVLGAMRGDRDIDPDDFQRLEYYI